MFLSLFLVGGGCLMRPHNRARVGGDVAVMVSGGERGRTTAGRATVVLRRGSRCVAPPASPLMNTLAQGALAFQLLNGGGSAKVAVIPAAALFGGAICLWP